MRYLNTIALLVLYGTIFMIIVKIDCKIGRGGGGSSNIRAGSRLGSRLTNLKPNRPNGPNFRMPSSSYRGGIRWSSFGAGMVAYGVMSSLISRGHYHHGYYRPGGSYSSGSGSTCINNEDFNGTTFGSFVCPLPGFNPSAKYCCGSLELQTQYCCEFFEDDNRKLGVILAIISVVGIITCFLACCLRILKRQKRQQKFDDRANFVQTPMNIRNVNRNMSYPGTRPYGGLRPMQMPGNNFNFRPESRPLMPMPPLPNNPNYNSNNLNINPTPYPTQPLIPQSGASTDHHPPSYLDAVKPNS